MLRCRRGYIQIVEHPRCILFVTVSHVNDNTTSFAYTRFMNVITPEVFYEMADYNWKQRTGLCLGGKECSFTKGQVRSFCIYIY